MRPTMSLALLQPALPERTRQRPAAPLIPIAVAMMAGITADRLIEAPRWLDLCLILGGAATGILLYRHRTWGGLGLLVAAIGLGSLRHAAADRWLAPDHVARYLAEEPIIIELTGRVASPPRIVEPEDSIPRAYDTGPRTRFLLAAESLAGTNGPIPVHGRIAATVKAAVPPLCEGDRIRMTGWLYRPRGPANPGEFDWAAHLRREEIFAGFSCAHAESVRWLDRAKHRGFAGAWSRARDRLRGYLVDPAFEESDEGAGIISAMVLGERGAVSRAMNEAFRRTGTSHYLAASGMQVAWLALIGWGFASLIGLYYRYTAVLIACLIGSYALIAEPEPSILRAVIIGLLSCAAAFFRGSYASLNALSCAAIILLLLRPRDLFSPGFQLSFLATLGLLHFCPRLADAIARLLVRVRMEGIARYVSMRPYPMGLFKFDDERGSTLRVAARYVIRVITQLFVLSIAEWIVTTPLTCYQFQTLAPWAWLASFVLWFVTLPATCLGYVTVLAGLLLPSSGLLLGPMVHYFVDGTVWCVNALAQLPGTLLHGRSPSLAWVGLSYAVMAVWTYRPGVFSGRWRHAPPVLAVLLIAWWAAAPLIARRGPPTLRVWMLAVGDGSGTVIELPDGRTILFDFGTRSGFDAGRLAADFLRERGISAIDAVLVSHPDFDHYSAVPQIATSVPVRRVILNDQFAAWASAEPSAREFQRRLSEARVPVEITSGAGVLLDEAGVRIEILWPPGQAEQTLPSANDASTVVRIEFEGRSVLLTGDITDAAMGGLMARGRIRADALALPHHGSVGALTARFIAAVNPSIAVRSTGQRRALTTNGIERLVGGATYYSTADDGAILIEVKNGDVSAHAVMRPDK